MQQADATQERVQGFRSIHKSQPPSTISAPLDSPDVVHIDCLTDPDTNKDFILWEEIEQAFEGALCVRNKTNMLPYLKGKDYRTLEPRRIAAVPDTILDVVVGGELPAAITDAATADMIVSLQRTLLEFSVSTPYQSPTSCARHNPIYGDEMEAMQNYNHMDVPAIVPSLRGPQATEFHSQDNANGNIHNNNNTQRLNGPQGHVAATVMGLTQTIINAAQGDVDAQVALGDRYRDGRDVLQDFQAAMDWYLKAAEHGHPRAQFNIGLLHEQGCGGVEQDPTMALDWFNKAADQGYADAQVKVILASTGDAGVSKDNINELVRAAENGHAESQYDMGVAYEKGHGVPQSNSKAFEWYTKSANQGFAEAQVRVAAAFKDGWGVPQSITKAVDWYVKAAFQGHTEAQSQVEFIYILRHACPPGQEAISKIKGWFAEAADEGVATAQYCMAYMYWYGSDARKDLNKAFEWFLKAAEQGYSYAPIRVAEWYENGTGVPQNREKAIEWYTKIVQGGRTSYQNKIDRLMSEQ